MAYIRCPRCELNYIDKKDKFCNVCKQEMKANGDAFYDDLEMELCPICHFNLITHDQDMCDSCREEFGDDMFNDETSKEWRQYVSGEEDDDLTDEEVEEESLGDGSSIVDIDDIDGIGLDDDEAFKIDDELEKTIADDMDSDDFDEFDDDDDDVDDDDDDFDEDDED